MGLNLYKIFNKGKHVYSSHPMYLMKENYTDKAFVFFFKNSNPIDIKYKKKQLTFRAIGGIFHFKIFLGVNV